MTVTTHCTKASKVAVAAVNVNVADAVNDPEDATANVVVPQPWVVGVGKVPNVQVGSKSVMMSLTYMCELQVKLNAIDVAS